MLLWPAVKNDILDHATDAKWLMENANDSYRSFQVVQDLPLDDIRRCIVMDPKR